MAATRSISTDDVPAGERLHWWGERIWGLIGRLHSDAYGDPHFSGSIDHGDLGYLTVCRLQVSRHRVVRTPNLIRQDDRGYVKIVAQMKGSASFEQNGRQVVLAPGEWSIYDTTKAYIVSNPEPIDQLALLLPRDRLVRLGLDLDNLVVRRFAGRSGVGRLAFDMLNSAFQELPALAGLFWLTQHQRDRLEQLMTQVQAEHLVRTAFDQQDALALRVQALAECGQHRGDTGSAMDALQRQHGAHRRGSSSASNGQRASAWARSCWAEKST